MLATIRLRLPAVLSAAAVCLAAASIPALASTATEEQQGAALAKQVQSGKRTCASLSDGEFERIGEYAMGASLTSVAQHEAMNKHMRAMMGTRGEELAHQSLGRVFAGCTPAGAAGSYPYGPGMMSGNGSGGYGPGMMGSGGYGPGMMGSDGYRAGRHHDWPAGATIAISLLVAALAGGLAAMVVTRRHHHPTGPA